MLLGLAFVAFRLQPGAEAKIFALALGGGIWIDATIIRGVLAPAADALFGRWNSEVCILQESFRFGTALRDAQLRSISSSGPLRPAFVPAV